MLSEKRAEIQNINQNPALSQAERSRQIQNLYSPASTLASVTLEDNESEFICRICFDGSTREDVISPCACSGSSKWVHRACLDKWRTTREDRAFSRCTECLKSYTLISTSPDTNSEKCWRKTKFILYVFRDLSIAFVLTQSIVFIIAWVVWCSDGSSGHGYLIKLLRAEAIPNVCIIVLNIFTTVLLACVFLIQQLLTSYL
jgi:hypothetical protein